MNRFFQKIALPGLAVLLLALAWWLAKKPDPERRPPVGDRSAASPGAIVTTLPPEKRAAIAPPTHVPRSTAEQLDEIHSRLDTVADAEASRRILAELKRLLDQLSADVASREVQAFLSFKKDAATKLDVTVKQGGMLGDASSMRVFLLDYLGQIDRPAAAAMGKQILSIPTSPDEWAVSLRNVAWADGTPGTLAYLRAKTREMISNPAWREKPSSGFLEAFDVIVHARGFDLAPQLTELVRDKENRAVAHAAYLTLDRLTIADPVAALTPLAAQPELMEGREQTRANFFARADAGLPEQRALLERYLLDPRRSAQELQTFAGLYPSANYMISNNLLTETATPAHAELATRDRAALQVVEAWLADERFARLKPQIESIHTRLRTFVQQAATPGR